MNSTNYRQAALLRTSLSMSLTAVSRATSPYSTAPTSPRQFRQLDSTRLSSVDFRQQTHTNDNEQMQKLIVRVKELISVQV